jgi:phosphatidylglycerol:prolipoprotein diacylglycerol transferase
LLPFLEIDIGIDPDLAEVGDFLITWHGLFSAIGIAAAVYLSAFFGKRQGIKEDDIYGIAVWAVIGGIIGARIFYVLEHLERFEDDPLDIFRINEGGITLYGGLIFGAITGFGVGVYRKLPCAAIADAAAMGMIAGQAFGRVGDLINGEHCGTATSLPWGVNYTHSGSPGFECSLANHGALVPVHPTAGGYELIFDILIFVGLALCWRYGWIREPGFKFFSYVIVYSVGRALLSELRLDEQMVGELTVPQVVAIVLVPLSLAWMYWLWKHPAKRPPYLLHDRERDRDHRGRRARLREARAASPEPADGAGGPPLV